MSGGGTRVLVAALLLITAGPWMPVLCFASGHLEVEMPYAACCGANAGFAAETPGDPLLLPPSSASDCGDCTDVPLVSVWPPESEESTVNVETEAASVPAGLELASEFSAILGPKVGVREASPVFESRPSLLRC